MPPTTSTLRVIVADDYDDAADVLADLLGIYGCEVRVAKNGRQAVDAFTASKPDAVILDLDMPVMTGYEACRSIRSAGFLGTVIAYTGKHREQVDHECRLAGFTDVVTKPGEKEIERLLGLR